MLEPRQSPRAPDSSRNLTLVRGKFLSLKILEARAGIELEPLCGRERVTAGDEWEPAGEILSAAKDLKQLEAFSRRERAAHGGEREPAAEILSAAKDLKQLEAFSRRERAAHGGEREPAAEILSRQAKDLVPSRSPMKAGGAGRNRTGDRGFADLGLTTWLPRLGKNPRRRRGSAISGAGDGI